MAVFILVAAATFGICYLFDKGFQKYFRNKKQHRSGLAVRLPKVYSIAGVLLSVLGTIALINGIAERNILLYGGLLVLLLGVCLCIYHLSFGIFYDEDSFVHTTFGKKDVTYRYSDILGQKLYVITGGSIVVAGPTRGGNSAVDYSGSAAITGGTMIAYGTSDMAQGFGKGSTQGAILLDTGSMPAGTDIVLSDGSSELMRTTAEKAFSCVLVSVPGMVQNGTYTVSVGSESHTVSLDGYQYSNVHGRFRH